MAKFCSLFSGSKGNCTYIGFGKNGILVDAGVSAKKITDALNGRNIDAGTITAIFLTHEHVDHISGVRVLAKKLHIPVYATKGTLQAMDQLHALDANVEYRELDENLPVDAEVCAFSTPHDAADSCGYIFHTKERKIAVCTDLGTVTDKVHEHLSGCDLVMLESNHDLMMLQNNTGYPYPLKRRIMSENGHLSNPICAGELVKLAQTGTTRFVLAHLSRDNNLPALAKETAVSSLSMGGFENGTDYTLTVAQQTGADPILL